jgi:hypothetical protein
MARRKKWDPESMKAAIEAMRNKEMGSYKASRVLTLPQTTLRRYVKDRQRSSSEAVKTKLCRKQVLPCEVENDLAEHCRLMERKAENDLAEHCRLMERKFFGLKMGDVMRLTYQLAVTNGIKNQFCKRN